MHYLIVEHPFSLPSVALSISCGCYLLQCALAALALRVVFYSFRAWAVVRGDFPESEKAEDIAGAWKEWTFAQAFRECFSGFSQHKAHMNLWLDALIVFSELATYPVLLRYGYLATIGGWLALRTAGNWGGWKVSRTSFNRFLLNNILELAIAYFWLVRFVQPT
jgi:hypothetical protein